MSPSHHAAPPHVFSIAAREELWVAGVCVESRLEHGTAFQRGRHIEARDDRDEELMRLAQGELEEMRGLVDEIGGAQLRLFAAARRIGKLAISSGAITITLSDVSIVSSREHAAADAEMLRKLVDDPGREDPPSLPLVWRGGSGAVLLHEAVGHAAEDELEPIGWPAWLSVRDEPPGLVDDCGVKTHVADLRVGPPQSMRRESFRDVPIRRMSRLVARQHGAPAELPDGRIEVHVVAGGSFEPLTDEVSIEVAVADVVLGSERRRLRPFSFVRTRRAIAASLIAATGEPIRYPGVICSREGQQLVVGSYAPVMVTR